MAGVASAKGINENLAYKSAFGNMPDGTTYVNGWVTGDQKGFDGRTQINERIKKNISQKALGTTAGGPGTASPTALVPVYPDPTITDLSRKYTPLVEMIPRMTNMGLTADYNVITGKGNAYAAKPDAPLPEQDDEYDRKSKSIKYLYSVGRVLGPMQAGMPGYDILGFEPTGGGTQGDSPFSNVSAPNATQLEVRMKARSLKEFEEDLILNGDSATNEDEFDGLIAQQGATNNIDLSGDPITWSDVENAVQTAFDNGGRPKMVVASSGVVTTLRQIMIDTLHMTPDVVTQGAELPFGIPPQIVLRTMVGNIPVIPSMFLSNNTGAKEMLFLDTDFIEMRVLQDMTYENLAKQNDSDKFMLKIYETLVVRAPEYNAYIKNIA